MVLSTSHGPGCDRSRSRLVRSGVAVVELAVLLPLLAFLFVIAIDFGRLFYYSVTLNNCARNGAVYGADPTAALSSPYSSIQQAALADAGNLSPAPTVNSQQGTDSSGNYIEVTVSYPFSTITQFPGVPNNFAIVRTAKMRMIAAVPSFSQGSSQN
jgi:Flp pilus assembly protein TadG